MSDAAALARREADLARREADLAAREKAVLGREVAIAAREEAVATPRVTSDTAAIAALKAGGGVGAARIPTMTVNLGGEVWRAVAPPAV